MRPTSTWLTAVVVVLLLAVPLAAWAQQAGSGYWIGLLDYSDPDAVRQDWWNAFRQQMRRLRGGAERQL